MSGSAESGQLLAIMGPTGCGKTSLLNVLAARVSDAGKSYASLSGEIHLNGKIRHDDTFRRLSAYVLQDDRLYAHLTVYETLLLSAHFFLPTTVSIEEKNTLVTDVMEELGLGKTRDTIVGDEKLRGISGGERKRANIAAQLISDPAVLFLDEPTSGLDSFQALAVMDSMKSVALNGRLVVTVIHQPRSSIFDMFDKLLLLSEGHAVYLGDAVGACPYFEQLGFACPQFFNPADFFLDKLSPDLRSSDREVESSNRIASLAAAWEEVDFKQQMRSNSEVLKDPTTVDINQIKSTGQNFELTRFFRNICLLAWRSFTEQIRNITALKFKVIVSIVFGGIIGGMYSETKLDQSGLRDRAGLLFIIAINQSFNNCIGVFNAFPNEKIIVNRERSSHAYDTFSYFLSKYVAETPLNVVPSLVYGCVVYWIAGLNPDRFGIFILLIMLHAVTSISLGLAVSAAAPSTEAASAIGVPFIIVPLIFAGFYINLNSLPVVANLLPYISFIRWTFEALCINEFQGEKFTCSGGSSSRACIKTGEAFLDSLAYGNTSVGDAVLGTSMLLIGFLLIAVTVLHLSKQKYLPLGFVGKKYAGFDKKSVQEVIPTAADSTMAKLGLSPRDNSCRVMLADSLADDVEEINEAKN